VVRAWRGYSLNQYGPCRVTTDRLTLIKPPSGAARRNGGCELIVGSSSAVFATFWNFGTEPRPIGGSCGGFVLVVRGDRASLLYTASSRAVADCG
jgi:hypothetical protein